MEAAISRHATPSFLIFSNVPTETATVLAAAATKQINDTCILGLMQWFRTWVVSSMWFLRKFWDSVSEGFWFFEFIEAIQYQVENEFCMTSNNLFFGEILIECQRKSSVGFSDIIYSPKVLWGKYGFPNPLSSIIINTRTILSMFPVFHYCMVINVTLVSTAYFKLEIDQHLLRTSITNQPELVVW